MSIMLAFSTMFSRNSNPCATVSFERTMSCLNNQQRLKTFLQIGANDGIMNDPVYPFLRNREDWVGLQVEPTPRNFEKLKKLHGNRPHWSHYNGAIAPLSLCKDGLVDFWERSESSDHWLEQGQANTVNPSGPHNKALSKVVRNCTSDLKWLIETHGSTKFQNLIKKQGLDLLQTDVECMDYDILRLADLGPKSPYRPHHIHYESLPCMGDGVALARRYLARSKYLCAPKGTNIHCSYITAQ